MAPAFELHIVPAREERVVLTLLGGACAAMFAAWAWSHVDALAGPAGYGPAAWLALAAGAALAGGLIGWRSAPRTPARLAWQQGRWSLTLPAGPPIAGRVQARIDLGSWLLLRFAPAGGGRVSWLAVGRRRAGPSWHALRATLFAPGAAGVLPGGDEGVGA
ncbi:MAG TPA: hypothetical protein VFZ28_16030 [Burkholderiaceae bacterium]|nr:hypothetical protein [Burkholderiaceae bacterium]